MKSKCPTYTPEKISRFVDNELDRRTTEKIQGHVHTCDSCQRLLKTYAELAEGFRKETVSHSDMVDSRLVSQKLDQALKASKTPIFGNLFGFFGKNRYLKLASITAVCIISFFTFQHRVLTPEGPSAIINWVDTDMTSVMIIETQKKQHTIIWFTET